MKLFPGDDNTGGAEDQLLPDNPKRNTSRLGEFKRIIHSCKKPNILACGGVKDVGTGIEVAFFLVVFFFGLESRVGYMVVVVKPNVLAEFVVE